MGIAVLIFSLIAIFAVSGGPAMMGMGKGPGGAELPKMMRPIIEPPARKSVMVDPEGMAVRTADGTQMTKRDRSRVTRQTFTPTPVVETPSAPVQAAEPVVEPVVPSEVVSSPAAPDVGYKYQEEMTTTSEALPVGAVEPTPSQKMEAFLAGDQTLSDSARVTLKANFKDGLLTLQGVVSDDAERMYLERKAKEMPDVQQIDNQLHTLNEYGAVTPK